MIPEIQAEFRITGIKISPEEITNLIGINPTSTWEAGEFIQKTKIKRKYNGWCLSTNEIVGFDLTESINNILKTLLPKAEEINNISNVYDLHCAFCFSAYVIDKMPVINFDEDIVRGLAKLNAAIDVDIILISE